MDECVQPLDVVADRRDRPLHHVLLVRLPAGGEEGEHLSKEIQESGREVKDNFKGKQTESSGKEPGRKVQGSHSSS